MTQDDLILLIGAVGVATYFAVRWRRQRKKPSQRSEASLQVAPADPPKPALERFHVMLTAERARLVQLEEEEVAAEKKAEAARSRIEAEWPNWFSMFRESINAVNKTLTDNKYPQIERVSEMPSWEHIEKCYVSVPNGSDDSQKCFGTRWRYSSEILLRTSITTGTARIDRLVEHSDRYNGRSFSIESSREIGLTAVNTDWLTESLVELIAYSIVDW